MIVRDKVDYCFKCVTAIHLYFLNFLLYNYITFILPIWVANILTNHLVEMIYFSVQRNGREWVGGAPSSAPEQYPPARKSNVLKKKKGKKHTHTQYHFCRKLNFLIVWMVINFIPSHVSQYLGNQPKTTSALMDAILKQKRVSEFLTYKYKI